MRGLDGAADGRGADEVDAVEVRECLGEVLALLYSFGGEVGVGDGLVVVDVVVALGVADEVDGSWGHCLARGWGARVWWELGGEGFDLRIWWCLDGLLLSGVLGIYTAAGW